MKELRLLLASQETYGRSELSELASNETFDTTDKLKDVLETLYLKNTGTRRTNRPEDFDSSFSLHDLNELCENINDDILTDWCFPIFIGKDKPDTILTVIVHGEDAGRHEKDIIPFLEQWRERYGTDFRNCYSARQLTFKSEEHLEAFTNGMSSILPDGTDDTAFITDPTTVRMILKIFGQKPVSTEKTSPEQKLTSILKDLTALTKSGWIPFSSPSPSSTEQKIRFHITIATDAIQRAISLTK